MHLQNPSGTMLRALPFWEHLSPEQRETLRERARIERYAKGQMIRDQQAECPGMLYIISGQLRAYLLSPEGKEMTLYLLRSEECCVLAASCALDAVSFQTEIIAEEPTEALLLPVDLFSRLMRENVYVERDVYRMTTERFSDVVAGVERLFFLSIEQRLIAFLLDEASRQHTDTLSLTHEQMAVNIGSAREVVSRTLKQLSEKGLVSLFRGGIRLVDRPALYQRIG